MPNNIDISIYKIKHPTISPTECTNTTSWHFKIK
jgi:hypothetical protein